MQSETKEVEAEILPPVERAAAGAKSKQQLQARGEDGLSAGEAAFVEAYLSNGQKKQRAAEAAGYTRGKAASLAATRLLHRPQVQAAIVKGVNAILVSLAPAAAVGLGKLGARAKSEYVQLEAHKAVVQMSGAGQQEQSSGPAVRISIDLG